MFTTFMIGFCFIAFVALLAIAGRSKARSSAAVEARDAEIARQAEAAASRPRDSYSYQTQTQNGPEPLKARPFGTDGAGYLPAWVAVVPLVLTLLFVFFGCFTAVDAKNVGVLTTFGKPADRTLGAGPHLKAPWQKVTEIDGTNLANEHKGENRLNVRLGDGSDAELSITLVWAINPDKANVLFGTYRSDNPTQTFNERIVEPYLQAASNAVLGEFNPIANLEVVEGSNAQSAAQLSFAPDFDQIATDIREQMESRLADQDLASVVDVTVGYLGLDKATQQKINEFTGAVGDTRIAAQKKSTATEEAAANRILSASVSNNPGVLQSKCLDRLADAIEKNYSLPAGFNCLGSGSAVVVPSTK